MKPPFSIDKLSAAAVLGVALCFESVSVVGNPTQPAVQSGDISFISQGQVLEIQQTTPNGIINWNSFSIDAGDTTRFIQPGTNSATLNRVTGASPSYINGNLLANGRVFLLNSNGVLIGSGGVIDVAGFAASTLQVDDQGFLEGGDLHFQGLSQSAVVNLGSISALDGDLFLIAAEIENAGSLSAPRGMIGLAAGNDVLITQSGSERIFVRGASGGEKESGVVNRGVIDANVAELKAHGGNVYGMAIKNEGRVAATSVSLEGGQIFLRAEGGRVQSAGALKATRGSDGGIVVVDGGAEGLAEVGGSVDVSGVAGVGGSVLVTGEKVVVMENSEILADGDTGGGNLRIGGGIRGEEQAFQNANSTRIGNGAVLSADARWVGDGGLVVSFAEDELFYDGFASAQGGSQSGNGGFIELSGKQTVEFPSVTHLGDTSAVNGHFGTLLIDPTNIDVVPDQYEGPTSGLVITNQAISTNLVTNNVIITTNPNPGGTDPGELGTITVFNGTDIQWSTPTKLQFISNSEIEILGTVTINAQGSGSLEINAEERVMIGNADSVTNEGSTFSTNLGEIIIRTGSGASARGTFINDAIISSIAGNIEIFGEHSNGDGTTISGSQISSSNGDISIEGRSRSGGENGNGLAFLSSSGHLSQVSNTGGIIKLAGQGEGTGKAIVFNDPDGSHSPNDFLINGGSQTDVELRSYGGDVMLSHLTGRDLSFETGDEVAGSLNLSNTNLMGQFQSPSSSGIFIKDNNALYVGDVSSSGPINFSGLNLIIEGQISSSQPVTLAGDSAIDLKQSLDAPGANLSGGSSGIEVNVEGTFSLEGVSFTNVDRVVGRSVVGDDVLVGSSANDEIVVSTVVTGNGGGGNNNDGDDDNDNSGGMQGQAKTVFTLAEVQFEGFEQVSGGGGDDVFNVNLDGDAPFAGMIVGGEGDDQFVMMPGGTVAILDGGSGRDVLDYSSFSNPVSANFSQNNATQVGEVVNLEEVIGGTAVDTLTGNEGDNQFRITGLNTGILNGNSFSDFELLRGLAGQDSFLFENQGSVDSFEGNSGADTFVLDDRNLTENNRYSITGNAVTRDTTYSFSGIETIGLLLGSGNDSVNMADDGRSYVLDGGAGIDTLNVLGDNLSRDTILTSGTSTISKVNFELPLSNEEMATLSTVLATVGDQIPGNNKVPDPDTMRSRIQTRRRMENSFSGGTGLSPAAFSALTTTSSTVLRQAVIMQAGGMGTASLNLDGSTGLPPVIVIDDLITNLDSGAWIELANAIGFAGQLVASMQDGATSLNLAELPPEDIAPILVENLRVGAAAELFEALELILTIPITSLDGGLSISTVPIPVEPEILALLAGILGNDSFFELAAALDG